MGSKGRKEKNSLEETKSGRRLGFKDLCKFNEAMLEKHVWKLIHDADSLFYRAFKTKYFPNCSIFEAKSSTGSYAWKSILRSRHLIGRGARWRVGDGQTIKIFHDAWLPTEDGKVTSPQFDLAPKATVALLINPVSS